MLQRLPQLLHPHACTKAFVDVGGNRSTPVATPPTAPTSLSLCLCLTFARAASVLLHMLPLISASLQPPVIVCKNEELYAAAMMSSAWAGDAARWWLRLSSRATPLAPPACTGTHKGHGFEQEPKHEQQDGQEQEQEQEQGPPPPPACFQSRRMHAERRVAAQRKAFHAHSAQLLQTCQSPAAASLASLDARRLELLQQYNSLSCQHRAASKAVGAAVAAARGGTCPTISSAGCISDMKKENKVMGERVAQLQLQLAQLEQQRNAQLAQALSELQQQRQQQEEEEEEEEQEQEQLSWYVKARANGFRSNPLRLPDRLNADGISICRPHNYRLTPHVTRHTSHVTRHTSHVTRHTSHVTRHTQS